MKWLDTPPNGAPEFSCVALGIEFTGRYANYTSADTWYPSWAADGALYSPWTDGSFGETLTFPHECSSQGGNEANKNHPGMSGSGQARIDGDDPMNLRLHNLGIDYAAPAPYGGRYPSASLCHQGVWYYGTYCVDESGKTDASGQPYNWDVLGPFVGFRISQDGGRSWSQCPRTPDNPLFGESGKDGRKVRMGVPHMVDFGQDMAGSTDGYCYLVGHGTDQPGSPAAWIRGDGAWMARARPDSKNPEVLNDSRAWQFFGGRDSRGKDVWVSEISASQPILRWPGRVGHATISWVETLSRFLMCITDGGDTISQYNSAILESSSVTGPWNLVTWMENFGEQAYFLNIPTKFLHDDGRGGWLSFSANFTVHHLGREMLERPSGSQYSLSLHEFRLGEP